MIIRKKAECIDRNSEQVFLCDAKKKDEELLKFFVLFHTGSGILLIFTRLSPHASLR